MVYTYFRGFNKAWNKNQPDVYEVSHAEYPEASRASVLYWARRLTRANTAAVGQCFAGAQTSVLVRCWEEAAGMPKNPRTGMFRRTGVKSWICRERPVWAIYRTLFESRRWWTLQPDLDNLLAVDGRGPAWPKRLGRHGRRCGHILRHHLSAQPAPDHARPEPIWRHPHRGHLVRSCVLANGDRGRNWRARDGTTLNRPPTATGCW